MRWRKSSRSDHEGGHCVEVAGLTSGIVVRDSKDPGGTRLTFKATEWRALTRQVKRGEHDLT
ncbi:DUF397 domain-containing protein [Actinomadura hibisca]|uniref:DUF397 domain-containing protein n=1 Tax=Actinomadura hibisca TaxID=68565 RepID=UPI000A0705B5|nr:DUF397 domain-containing protein [Actinomadura hibisca]